MNLNRLRALAYRDVLIIMRSQWRLVEIFYFPITTMVIWGLFSLYTRELQFQAGLFVLIVNVFWNFAYVSQSTVNMQMMEDSWSGSLKQLFLSGISEVEYIFARMVTSTAISLGVLLMLFGIAYAFIGTLPGMGTLAALSVLTLFSSLALAALISAMVVILGRSYGFLAWSALQAFVLFSAPFYPKEIFPGILQYIAAIMPYTHIFEAARHLSAGEPVSLTAATIVTTIYFIGVWPLYIYFFRLARKTGKLVRMG